MPGEDQPNDNFGDTLIASMQTALGEYLKSPKAMLARAGSGIFFRSASQSDLDDKTATRTQTKSTNVQVALEVKNRLKQLENPALSQEEKFSGALNILNKAIAGLKGTESQTLGPALSDVRDRHTESTIQQYVQNHFAASANPPNYFGALQKRNDEERLAWNDIYRNRSFCTIDGTQAIALTGNNAATNQNEEKAFFKNFENNWKEGKTPEQQALIEAAAPYLHQSGLTQQAAPDISMKFLALGISVGPQPQIAIETGENEIFVKEHYIINEITDMNDNPPRNVTLETPIVITQEFSVKFDEPDTSADLMKGGKDREEELPDLKATTTAFYYNPDMSAQLKQNTGPASEAPSSEPPTNSPPTSPKMGR